MSDDVRVPVAIGGHEGLDYGGLDHALPDSVTGKVVRSAEVPVLTVPA